MVKKHRMYVVKKYIKALSAEDAIRQDKTHKVDDVYVDEDYKNVYLAAALGIPTPWDDDEEEE